MTESATTPSIKKTVSQATTLMPRSWLFVPASRPDRFEKALSSGADAIIIDLEDAVAAEQKAQARQDIIQFMTELAQSNQAQDNHAQIDQTKTAAASVWIRINNDEQLSEDLALCADLKKMADSQQLSNSLAGVFLPKLSTAEQINRVFAALELPIIGQIESAVGIHNLSDITKEKGLHAISYGRLDISNELDLRAGSQAEQDFFNQLRIQLLLISKVNSLQAPIESIFADFKDEIALDMVASYAADLGFSGMLCIHPKQLESVSQAFRPTEKQLAFAQQVVDHYQQTSESVFAIDGAMVDLPVILQCQKIVESDIDIDIDLDTGLGE